MLRNFTILVFTAIIAAAGVSAQKADDRSADETMIRANVAQLEKGWNAKNGADFAKPFAEDAAYVVINGMRIKSRLVIAKAHQGIFDTIYKNTTLALTIDAIRFLGPDVAVVQVSGSMKLVEGEATRTERARMTHVMTKTGDRWEIVAFQNTRLTVDEKTK
jgi:uncharacterized protein (TIGR02246 family)